MDVSHRTIALAGIEKRILCCWWVVPAYLALNVWACFGINNTTVDLNSFLFKLIAERIERVVVRQLLINATHFMSILRVLGGSCIKLIVRAAIGLLVARLREFGSVVFHIELDPTQLDNIPATEFVVEVVLGWFSVPDHYEHLVVDILVRNWVALKVPRSLCNNSIVFNLKLA